MREDVVIIDSIQYSSTQPAKTLQFESNKLTLYSRLDHTILKNYPFYQALFSSGVLKQKLPQL